ncbi:hypothetical protein [Umezakia ovalisporum]|jgi:hypothetical protein|uniref:Uncharacterized protein n=2 Tax=Umezakia ovalisporum TaxID=75695 RepID=A0AA43GY21_9CYAN|nr:hypothetical protein [Umezakia ovalisporum]MBI1240503.1 hypothetical protein [Nostoc sp. RI_552]MDH6058745.1 hypothetical protein [Umezakia ovalisporum FSS-43]MDH6063691.1 hypothetical protein [Umezakia ovalisporum FSS-62]MDH6066611.1 hypothetical protein [Umezakia ovalisporum APH033B]MDH6072259.1 hypothetical protein [Umezakia ovalisporum CobakiLakeA]
MDSESYQRYQATMVSTDYPHTIFLNHLVMTDGTEHSDSSDILTLLHSGKVFVVNSRKRNGLILFKRYHAEFAGPGAAVGGNYDRDCERVLPIGNLSLLIPETYEEREKAYLIRRQWIRLIKQITENQPPQQRIQKILDQFEQYFPPETVAQMPDIVFALLVGVFPQTVGMVRRLGNDWNDKFSY